MLLLIASPVQAHPVMISSPQTMFIGGIILGLCLMFIGYQKIRGNESE